MGGMKSGSGDDPFADDDAEDDADSAVSGDEGGPAGDDPFASSPSTTDEETPTSSSSTAPANDALPGVPDHPADQEHTLRGFTAETVLKMVEATKRFTTPNTHSSASDGN